MEFHLSSSTFRFFLRDTIVLAAIELSQPKTDTFIGLNTIIFFSLPLVEKNLINFMVKNQPNTNGCANRIYMSLCILREGWEKLYCF